MSLPDLRDPDPEFNYGRSQRFCSVLKGGRQSCCPVGHRNGAAHPSHCPLRFPSPNYEDYGNGWRRYWIPGEGVTLAWYSKHGRRYNHEWDDWRDLTLSMIEAETVPHVHD